MRRLLPLLAAALLLSGCGDFFTRLSEVGGPPRLTPTGDPTKDPSWHKVSLPMPPVAPIHAAAD